MKLGEVFRSAVGLAAFTSAVALSGGEAARQVPGFVFPEPLPAVLAAAEKENIEISRFDPPRSRIAARPGDGVTNLVSVGDMADLTQWLIETTVVEPEANEREAPLARLDTFYTSGGTEVRFSVDRVVLRVRVAGPFRQRAGGSYHVVSRRIVVNADLLGIALDEACKGIVAVQRAFAADPKATPPVWAVRRSPFPEDEAKETRTLADRIGRTPACERALVGAMPALSQFFDTVNRTPALQEILKSVVDLSWWSLLKNAGAVRSRVVPMFGQVAELNLPEWTHPEIPLHQLPFTVELNGKAALVGDLAVAASRPPLLTTAGIVAVSARGPSGTGPRFSMRVLAACADADLQVSGRAGGLSPIAGERTAASAGQRPR